MLHFRTLSTFFRLEGAIRRRKENFDHLHKVYHVRVLDRRGFYAGYVYLPDLENMSLEDAETFDFNDVLDTKLDIEKALLLQWADDVGLIPAGLYRPGTDDPVNYDMRLADEATQTMIKRALNYIVALLTNAPELKQGYGLTEAPEDSEALTTTSTMLSSPRWERFCSNYRFGRKPSMKGYSS
ncbi:hypothetical protein MFIFM68171_10035 [Madurella fahalii]|uniref:Prion-inhibition and propagation HeLo domain-containing protein n=1 Tax=Madurella fahalii TaxID=1157608 RepID=A0ABQ0GQ24_9PEZI